MRGTYTCATHKHTYTHTHIHTHTHTHAHTHTRTHTHTHWYTHTHTLHFVWCQYSVVRIYILLCVLYSLVRIHKRILPQLLCRRRFRVVPIFSCAVNILFVRIHILVCVYTRGYSRRHVRIFIFSSYCQYPLVRLYILVCVYTREYCHSHCAGFMFES